MNTLASLHLFCRVVDNYGDIGVCWRLARQFQHEHGLAVTLWVDELTSFKRICPELDPLRTSQDVQGVRVRKWDERFEVPEAAETADVVIEAFGCELPRSYLDAMTRRQPRPVWINLEYLSAEAWVEGCHGLSSRHPQLSLEKYFFFPGFTEATGGLPVERDLSARRAAFQGDAEHTRAFLQNFGVKAATGGRVISLFCYPQAPVVDLFAALRDADRPTVCLVPEGIATDAVQTFLGANGRAGARAYQGALTVHVLPFMSQADYDRLLWSCDLNFVRGEDSFVRAQLAARPFVWQIYPQQSNAHWNKFDAFLARYCQALATSERQAMEAFWRTWNGVQTQPMDWTAFESALPVRARHAQNWAAHVVRGGDLATRLVQFAEKFG
jgi:uncharacterized repeat protein (TIGR03837 family)